MAKLRFDVSTSSLALTATPAPPAGVSWAQLGLVVVGTTLIVGVPFSIPWLVAVGGAAFVAATGILAWMLWRSWGRALNKRHALPMAAYGAAVLAALIGGTLGALLGSHSVVGVTYVHVRRAHMTLNVLDAGVLLAFTGAGLALAKAWFFPLLGLGPVDSDRPRAIWGG